MIGSLWSEEMAKGMVMMGVLVLMLILMLFS